MRITHNPTHWIAHVGTPVPPTQNTPRLLGLLGLVALGLFLICNLALAQTPRAIALQEALQLASRNAESQLAQQQLQASKADMMAADRAPAPVLSTSVSQIDLQNGVGAGSWLQDKRVDKNIGVDWTWERGNKRQLRTRSAAQQVQASSADLREVILQQQLQAQAAFFDLWAAQERLTHIQAMAQSALDLAQVAQKRLSAGDLSAQDALRSQIEAQRAQSDGIAAQQDRVRAELTLNMVLDLGVQKLLAKKDATPLTSKHWATAINPSNMGLPERIALRPDVIAAQTRVDAAKTQLDQALALQRADVTVGAAWDHFPGTSTKLLTLRMQIPLQIGALGGYTFQGEIDKARAQLASSEVLLERTTHAASLDVLRQMQDLQSGAARAQQYQQGIAPAAKRVAEQAELAYSKGALSLTDLLEARRTYRASALEAISAQLDFDKASTAWNIRHDKP